MPSASIIEGAQPLSASGSGANADTGVAVVHGFTGNPVSVRPMADAFVTEGCTVEMPLLPGHGTTWRDMSRTRYSDWRAEVERVVDDLRQRTSRVVLFGFSLGGTIALDLAEQKGDEIAALVLVNTPILDRTEITAKLAPILQYVLPVVPSSLAGIAKNDCAKGGDEKAYPYTPSKAGYSFTRELPRIRRDIGLVKCPVLVAYSAQDHTVPAANAKWLLKALGDRATELVLERSYHLALLDYDAVVLQHATLDFVARTTDAGATG